MQDPPVRAEKPKALVHLELTAASPTLAAQQWTQRYAQSSEAEGSRSVKLLATALRSTRLVLLTVEEGPAPRTKALLALGGLVAARAEREGALDALLLGETADVTERNDGPPAGLGKRKRAGLWVGAVGAIAVAAAGGTLWMLRAPPPAPPPIVAAPVVERAPEPEPVPEPAAPVVAVAPKPKKVKVAAAPAPKPEGRGPR